jgi:hypothetical protein
MRSLSGVVTALKPIGRVILDCYSGSRVYFHLYGEKEKRAMNVDLNTGIISETDPKDEIQLLSTTDGRRELAEKFPDDFFEDRSVYGGVSLFPASDRTTQLVTTLVSHSARSEEIVKGLRLYDYRFKSFKLIENYLGGWTVMKNDKKASVSALITTIERGEQLRSEG